MRYSFKISFWLAGLSFAGVFARLLFCFLRVLQVSLLLFFVFIWTLRLRASIVLAVAVSGNPLEIVFFLLILGLPFPTLVMDTCWPGHTLAFLLASTYKFPRSFSTHWRPL